MSFKSSAIHKKVIKSQRRRICSFYFPINLKILVGLEAIAANEGGEITVLK